MLVLSRKPGEALTFGPPFDVVGRWRVASPVCPTETAPSGGTAGPADGDPSGGTSGPAPCQAFPPLRDRPRGSSPSRPGHLLGRTAKRDVEPGA
jgi:hypothetical protein